MFHVLTKIILMFGSKVHYSRLTLHTLRSILIIVLVTSREAELRLD